MNAKPDASLDARRAAALCLEHVMIAKRQSDIFFSSNPHFLALNPQDRAFCQRMVRTMLRHMGELEAIFLPYFKEPLGKKKYGALAHIYLAAAEISYASIPSYAAINSAVELVKIHYAGLEKMANAMLRRWLREHGEVIPPSPEANIPAWLHQKWQADYDNLLPSIAEALLIDPPLDISFISPDARGRFIDAMGGDAMIFGHGARVYKRGAVSELPGYAEGWWWVQDAAAALPAHLLGDIKGKRALDMCAAPGGKAMQLAALGAEVTALDNVQSRLDVVAENIERVGLAGIQMRCHDALSWEDETGYDAILLDAPCSATGTLRRNPDVKYLRNADNLLKATVMQAKLLDKAITLLKPGGRLVYCVCSMEQEEGEDIITAALAYHKNMVLAVDADCLALDVPASSGLGLRTHPALYTENGGLDGFFMTCLQKKS